MTETKPILRWIFAIGCFGVSAWMAKTGYDSLDPGYLGLALLLFVVAFASIFTKLLAIAARPFTLLIDSIFFPGGPLSRPILNLKLPHYYLREGRYDEALEEYRKIIRFYPDEAEAYEGAIELLVRRFQDFSTAEKLYRKSRRRHLVLNPVIDTMMRNLPYRSRNRTSPR